MHYSLCVKGKNKKEIGTEVLIILNYLLGMSMSKYVMNSHWRFSDTTVKKLRNKAFYVIFRLGILKMSKNRFQKSKFY